MGNCCGNEEEERPLLGSGSNRGPIGARSGTLSPTDVPAAPSYMTQQPRSARTHNPVDHRDFETSIELISKVDLQQIPIATMNKTFQDSGRLYNEIVDNFRSLENHIHKFKEHFVEETAGIPILATCVRILRQRCGDAEVTIERKSKNHIDVKFDVGEIRKNSQGDPEKIINSLQHYRDACKQIRNILDHAPQLEKSVSIVLNTEEDLRKDIVKLDLTNEERQKALKAVVENVSKLRSVAAGSDTIKRDVEKKFKEFSKASECFFTETEDK